MGEKKIICCALHAGGPRKKARKSDILCLHQGGKIGKVGEYGRKKRENPRRHKALDLGGSKKNDLIAAASWWKKKRTRKARTDGAKAETYSGFSHVTRKKPGKRNR